MRSIYVILGWILLMALFQRCKTSQPAVYPEPVIGDANFDYWIHSPLHPDNKQEVVFKTKVSDKKGIEHIELYVYEYELYETIDGLPSKRRRIDSQWGLVYEWDFDGETAPVSVAFPFARGFRAFTNIEYIFKVYNTSGEVSERLAIFDAGESRWPLDNITLYATSRTPLANSINLCLFPDTDYNQDWRAFLTDMESMIYDGFHQNNKIKDHKKNWQFYYTQQEADGKAISQKFYDETVFPDFIKDGMIPGMDAYGLMHRESYSDGAYLKNNIHFLAYNLFTSESYNFGTAVHEAAHAIFNLSDEYDLCACFEHPEGANVFASLKGCQEFNVANGFPISDCTPLEHLNGQSWYMSEPSVLFTTRAACEAFNGENGYTVDACEKFKDLDGNIYYRALEGLCIMQDDGDEVVRDFQRTCSRIIDKYYERLETTPLAARAKGVEDVENIFGYEPVLLMELQQKETQLAFQVKGIENGVPKKSIFNDDAIKLDFLQSSGRKLHSLSLPDPQHIHIHRGDDDDEMVDMPEVQFTFAVPYTEDLQSMICAQQARLGGTITLNHDNHNPSPFTITRFDLETQLQQTREIWTKKE